MKEVHKDLVEAFQSLFRGRTDAWGSVGGLCNKETVTLEHYARHLLGETSLGIYPLLDDGTCHFAAIDIDIKDFTLTKKIRGELKNHNIPAYITASKSKGFHIYCFALEKFNAKEIRRVLNYILNKLGIKAEIFPKQDILSATIPFGSYINLPVFGYTRPFLTGDLKEVPLEIAVNRIKYVPQEAINQILKEIPKEPPPKTREARQQRKHPPCIDKILEGVEEPGRDEAAFALARYYLDQRYSSDDISELLRIWDARNKPPLGDERLLQAKVKSAEKGYAFGCSSITDNAMLYKFCVGVDKCEWIKLHKKTEFKIYFEHRPEVRPALDFVNDKVYVTIPMDIDIDITKKVKGETQVVGKKRAQRLVTITSNGETFPTADDNFMSRGLDMVGTVSVPRRRWSLGSIRKFIDGTPNNPTFIEIFELVKQQYKYYMELPTEDIYSFVSLWVMGSYFFPIFDAYPYTFFGGVREVGKTKMLTITQQLAFNAVSSGNISTASLFRMIEGGRTTLLIDEAEKLGRTERGEEFKNILNAGYKPGNPVYRAEKTLKEQFIVVVFDAYSPKMLANIAGLEDILESRVVPFYLTRTLNKEIANREIDTREEVWQDIRDKLYILAMTKWKEVKEAYGQVQAPATISARNWEIWRPIIALARVTDDTGDLEAKMLALGEVKSEEKLLEAATEAPDSVLVRVLVNIVIKEDYYSVKEIMDKMVETYGEPYKWLTKEWIGKAMKRQGFSDMVFQKYKNPKIWKHRIGTGVEYLLTRDMVELAARKLGIGIGEESGESGEGGEGKDIDMEV